MRFRSSNRPNDSNAPFWDCERAAVRGMSLDDGLICAEISEEFKHARFGGDFDALLAYWHERKAAEVAELALVDGAGGPHRGGRRRHGPVTTPAGRALLASAHARLRSCCRPARRARRLPARLPGHLRNARDGRGARRQGRGVKVAGDPSHPTTQGVLCTKVSRYLERTYHPDRVLHPLKRAGRKGEGRFERVSWDEALADIAARLQAIAAVDPQRMVPYSYAGTMGLVQGEAMASRFFHKLGASFLDRTICATAGAEALNYTLGTRTGTDVEQFDNSKLIVFWGTNAITSNLHLWSRAQEAKRRGAKLVAIDPYRSLTAEKCHQHIALLPGTDAALALGLVHVLVREGWLDRDYIARHTLGFEALAARAAEFAPQRVAELCGITAQEVEGLAHDYWHIRPAAIRLNYGMQRAAGGGNAVRAVASLPALAGHWRDPAGGLLLSTSGMFPVDAQRLYRPDLLAGRTPRTINMSTIGHDLLNAGADGRPPIEALVVYNSNPVAVAPQSREVAAGFAREDLFTVVLEHFRTDTADYADYVLPATTQLEHIDVHKAYGHLYVLANNPAIAPLGEALPNSEIFRRLARAMGYTEPCFAEDDDALAAAAFTRQRADGCATTGRGSRKAAGNGSTCRRRMRRSPRASFRRPAASASSSPSASPRSASIRCPATCRRTKGRSAIPPWRSVFRWRSSRRRRAII